MHSVSIQPFDQIANSFKDLRIGHDFSCIPVYHRTPSPIQTKLTVNTPGDIYEQEADRVADQVMRMPEPRLRGQVEEEKLLLQPKFAGEVQCQCVGREEEDKVAVQAKPVGEAPYMSLCAENCINNTRGGGQPLPKSVRSFFEPRFGYDFSQVRLHTDEKAAKMSWGIQAKAFTHGSDIYFNRGQYAPDSVEGRRMLAHELVHIVQQGAVSALSSTQYGSENASVEMRTGFTGAADRMIQRWPGDGLLPPGVCSWKEYIPLRGAVETAKALVNSMGRCGPGDSCSFLAVKIAAIAAEISARIAINTICYLGGDRGHRVQVQDRVNMMNTCYEYFTRSNCPQQLLEAMKAVVARALEVIAEAAKPVIVAVVVLAALAALIAAIILLIKAIIAAAAVAAVAAAAAAVAAILLLISDLISSDTSSTASSESSPESSPTASSESSPESSPTA
jgi:hypothetical protein